MTPFRRTIYVLIAVLVLAGCRTDSTVNDNHLIVRLSTEPDRLNPILSRGSTASQIENFIFQPLAEVDPLTLEFDPILLEKISEPVVQNREDYGVVDRLDIQLKADATWSDGEPITYHDILFTLKTILNPEVGVARFRSALSFIKGEDHDENDLKFLTFYLDTAVFNADKMLTNFHILPRHIYDSVGYMTDIPFELFVNNGTNEAQNENLKKFAMQFTDEKFSRNIVAGSGPYELDNWNAGYELKLKRKSGWWGSKYESSNLFKAIPEAITYKIIPDEQLAVTAIANDNIHVIAGLNPEKFRVLQETGPEKYQFLTPKIPQYYYILLNNQSPFLSDVRIRQALAHLIDQNKMIEVVMNGYGMPLTSPLSPDSKYYDKSIAPYSFDVDKAAELLEAAGWADSNDNGILDREIDQAQKELTMRICITGSELGRKIALLLQDNAKKAGIDIEIKTQKFNPNSMNDMRSGDFEMVATAARQSFLESYLKPTWHSSGYTRGGGNLMGFMDDDVDRILDALDTEEDMDDRIDLYHEFHAKIHEQVPVLFLLMPTERVLVSNDWHVDESPRRPGYFENLSYLK